MGQPFIGQVIAVGFNFVPEGWLPCDGSLVPISQYDVLFNLIGTTYGGNGTTNFGLPDLRGRSPLNAGQGNGLSPYVLGQKGGAENITLTAAQVGPHNHQVKVSTQAGTGTTPGSGVVIGQAQTQSTTLKAFGAAPGNTTMSGNAIGLTGGGQPHENCQPLMTINYIICWAGIYPSQN